MYLSIFESGDAGVAEALSINPASLYSAFDRSQMDARRKENAIRCPCC
jgi:hypothetical protein